MDCDLYQVMSESRFLHYAIWVVILHYLNNYLLAALLITSINGVFIHAVTVTADTNSSMKMKSEQ